MIILLVMAARPALAYNWDNNHGASAIFGYDDNFLLSPSDEIDTSIIDLGFFAALTGEEEVSSLSLLLGVRHHSYSESSIDDETSYDLSFDITKTGERFSSSLSAILQIQPTTETELLDSGLLELEGSRDSVSVTPGLSYQVSERSLVSASLTVQDVTYDTVSLTEYTDTSLLFNWVFDLDATSSFTSGVGYSVFDPDEADETDSSDVRFGYSLIVSEETNYDFSIGFTEVDRPSGSENGETYGFEVNHQPTRRDRYMLALNNSFEPSGLGEIREETGLDFQWDHSLTETSQFVSTFSAVNTDGRDYYSLQLGGSSQYSPQISVSLNFRYREQEDTAEKADSRALFFSISYSPI